MKYTKSCLNYTGGKYRLLKQILPLFPLKIDKFIDLFCGGANVSLNVNAKNIYCYDNNDALINLFNYLKNNELNLIKKDVNNIIKDYNLSNTEKYGYNYYKCNSSQGLAKFNKKQYVQLREDYNKNSLNGFSKCLYFYTLIIFGFNNQIRFNKKKDFNNPVGKRDFNKNTQKNLMKFHHIITKKNIKFECYDFRDVNLKNLTNKDFVYLDPPYLITTASYNEQNGWTIKDEKDLLCILDELNEKNIKFALSNVLESKGKSNKTLKKWSKNYNIHYLNYSYANSNYQSNNKQTKTTEVLICNY